MEIKKEVFTKKDDGIVEFNRKEADYVRNKLIHLAKKKIESNKCECGNKKRKVVPLFEFGDPYIPSQVILYCPKCKRNETFATRPVHEARQYAELVAGKKYESENTTQRPMSEIEKANKVIEMALERARKPMPKPVEKKDESVKDDDNEIIADKETVNEIDSKKK